MRVLQIIDSLITGGAEKLLLDTIPLYRKKGIEMDILVLQDRDYPFLKELRELNVCKIYNLGTGSVYNPFHILKIASILKDYDIAHVHLFPAQYFALIANKINGNKTKLIFTEHSTSNRRMHITLFKPIEKYVYKEYDKTISITNQIKQIISNHVGISEDKLCVIENGVNLKIINDSIPIENIKNLSKKIRANDRLVIQVSSFHEPKDQKTLILSLKYLPDNYKVVLVGDGVQRKLVEEFADKENLNERVIFLGKRSDVPRLLKSADIVVLSSKYEGLSLSSIEGMASGKPFIASDVPGLTEIVKGYGILFPLGNARALAKEILNIMSDSEYYNKVVKRCQKRAKQFDIHDMVNNHIKLYNELYNDK